MQDLLLLDCDLGLQIKGFNGIGFRDFCTKTLGPLYKMNG